MSKLRVVDLRRVLDGLRLGTAVAGLPFLVFSIRTLSGRSSSFSCLWCVFAVVVLVAAAALLWRTDSPLKRLGLVSATGLASGAILWLLPIYQGGIGGHWATLHWGYYVVAAGAWVALGTGVLEIVRVARLRVQRHEAESAAHGRSPGWPWQSPVPEAPMEIARRSAVALAVLSAATLWVGIAVATPDAHIVPAGARFRVPLTGSEATYLGFEIVAFGLLLVLSTWARLCLEAAWGAGFRPDPGSWMGRGLSLLARTGLPLLGLGALAWKALPRSEGPVLAAAWSALAVAWVVREKRFRLGTPSRWSSLGRIATTTAAGLVGVLALFEWTGARIPGLGIRVVYRPVFAAGLDLARVDLRRRVLQFSDLSGSDLRGANFEEADLWGARLQDSDLRDANLVGARLVRAELQRADLRGAQLDDANLARAVLFDADLRGAVAHWSHWEDSNLSGADLRGAQLEESRWDYARAYGANLNGADLRGARFDATELRDALLRGARLRDADLTYANLERADLEDADLRGAVLRSVRFQRANLRGADLSSARDLDPVTIRSTCFDASTRFPFDASELLADRTRYCEPFAAPNPPPESGLEAKTAQ